VSGAVLGDLVNPAERVERYRRQGLWTSDTLASRVNHHADHRPNRVAVVDQQGQRSATYAQLRRDSAAVARQFARHGLCPGDVISLQLPNRYEAVVVAVAAQSLGAVINPLLPNYRNHELDHVFRTARPRLAITPGTYRGWDFVPMISDVRAATGIDMVHIVDDERDSGDVSLRSLIAGAEGTEGPLDETSSPVSELIFTSGTEATPKAIMHTEENANLAVRTLFSDLGTDDARVVWMPSPVGHSTGFNYGLRAALYHGVTLVLQDRWDASDAIELVNRFGCNYTLAATTFMADLVAECERSGHRLPQLAQFGCGGSAVPPDLVYRAEQVGITVLRLYGSTEVLCATWNRQGDPMVRRANTDGRALSNTEIEVRGDDSQVVPADTPGELHIRSAQASVGFFADPERTAATYLPDGWIRSGDLATMGEDGHITIVGRKKEIIIRGGINIAPREIEDLLAVFPEVERVAVVGLPHQRLGEQACACVVLRPGSTLDFDTMVARLRADGLASYKLPERLQLMDELPTTASGKVQKHQILRILAAGTGKEQRL
jgi:cyclohexanecarboxylate-CoA ligase